MLQYGKLKNHAGMMVVGDYETLRALHDVIHKMVKTSALLREERHGDFLLGLAYEVRKAFELQREILEPPPHYDEIGRRFGVKMLWPVLLVQVRVLREAMAFCPTDARDQGMVCLLEHATLEGLNDDFGDPSLVERWRGLTCNPPSILERVESRAGLFLQWSKARRRTGLAQLLASFDPMFEFWYERNPAAWHNGISPRAFEEIAKLADFPDPRW